MNPIFQQRNFTDASSQPAVDWTIASMEWDCHGGPRMAQLTPQGSDNDIWQLANMLRAPVTIYDNLGRASWWGYVSEVHLANKGARLGVGYSLDNMANYVACAYSWMEVGGTVVEERVTTGYNWYTYGTATYGQKDYITTMDAMTGAAAIVARDNYLYTHQIPQGVAEVGGMGISVVCRGWWDTMNWRIAYNNESAGTVITSHLSSLVTTYGQFISGVVQETTNGGTIAPYWSGDYQAYEEAERLMAMGGANGRQVNVRVDDARRAIFSEEPAKPTTGTAAYYLDRKGNMYDNAGGMIDPHMAWTAVGNYVQLRDVVGATTDTTLLLDPSVQFLDGVTWNAGQFTPEFRGEVNARDIVKAKE